MDRRYRSMIASCGLGLIVAATVGCRSPRSDVPPGRGFSPDGRQVPPIGFSQDGRGPALAGSSASSYQTPGGIGTNTPPGMTNYGAPVPGGYGPPGSSMGNNGMPMSSPSTPSAGLPPSYGNVSQTSDPAASPSSLEMPSIPPSSAVSPIPPGGSAAGRTGLIGNMGTP